MTQNENQKTTRTDVIAEVANSLANSAPEVKNTLVKIRVQRELDRRVNILDQSLVKREQLQKEVYGLKKPGKQPNKIVNDDGSVTEVPATYTPEEFKKHEEEMKSYNKRLKEMTESLERFDKNLEEAFTNPTDKAFEKLEKISKGAQPE